MASHSGSRDPEGNLDNLDVATVFIPKYIHKTMTDYLVASNFYLK